MDDHQIRVIRAEDFGRPMFRLRLPMACIGSVAARTALALHISGGTGVVVPYLPESFGIADGSATNS